MLMNFLMVFDKNFRSGTNFEKINLASVKMHNQDLFEIDSANLINGKRFKDPNNIVNE